MKNINHANVPHFQSLTTKDPSTFLFKFEVVYITYDYVANAEKIKISLYIDGINLEMVHKSRGK